MSSTDAEGDERGAFSGALGAPRVEGYEVLDVLGAGGHSTVYLARDAAGREVALKHWRDAAWSPQLRERVRREVAALRELDHPRLVGFVELIDDPPCVVMQRVQGPNLAEVLEERSALPPEEVRALALQLLDALEHLAGRGLVHRDLKPSNVVIGPEGPILVDFSIVKRLEALEEDTLTGAQSSLGTSAYMAPEQCAGDLGSADARTDVYGLGALLYHALCGVPPWRGESGWERTQRNPWRDPYPAQLDERARVRAAQASAPPALARVIATCLEGSPARRYASPAAVRRALEGRGPQRAPWAALAATLSLCLGAAYVFFDQTSRGVPNEGQAPDPTETAMNSPLPTIALVTSLAAATPALGHDPRAALTAAELQALAQAPLPGAKLLRAGDDETPARVKATRERALERTDPLSRWIADVTSGAKASAMSLWGEAKATSKGHAGVWVNALLYPTPGAARAALAASSRHKDPLGWSPAWWLVVDETTLLRFDVRTDQEGASELLKTVLAAYEARLAPRSLQRIDLNDLGEAARLALMSGSPCALERVIRPQANKRAAILGSVGKVRRYLTEKLGMDVSRLRLVAVLGRDARPRAELPKEPADLYLLLTDGPKDCIVRLDDCVFADGRWRLTDKLVCKAAYLKIFDEAFRKRRH